MSLTSDIAASQAADIAQVISQLRSALVALLDATTDLADEPAWKNAQRLVSDLDAGELLWPGWKKARA